MAGKADRGLHRLNILKVVAEEFSPVPRKVFQRSVDWRTYTTFHEHQIIWKNGSFRNRENLQYKKTADSVCAILFGAIDGLNKKIAKT